MKLFSINKKAKNNSNINNELYNQTKIKDWIKRGEAIIYPERYDSFEQMVYDNTKEGNFFGNDIETALNIMELLEMDKTILQVKEIMILRNCNEHSKSLIRNIVFSFSRFGPDFWLETAENPITSEGMEMIKQKTEENNRLKQKYESIEKKL